MNTLINRFLRQAVIVFVAGGLALAPIAASANSGNDNDNRGMGMGRNEVKNNIPGLEVQIGNKGNVLVRGAKVTGVSGSVISAVTAWGSTNLAWSVKVASSTKFVRSEDKTIALSNIVVGDTVSFNGTLDTSVSGLSVNASLIKDWSASASASNHANSLNGIVTAIDSALSSFTLAVAGIGAVAVQTSSTTSFTEDGKAATFGALSLGDTLKVSGLLNAASTTLSAISVSISDKLKISTSKKSIKKWLNSHWGIFSNQD